MCESISRASLRKNIISFKLSCPNCVEITAISISLSGFAIPFAQEPKRITLDALIPFSLRRRAYLLIKFISFLPKVDYLAILESFLFY